MLEELQLSQQSVKSDISAVQQSVKSDISAVQQDISAVQQSVKSDISAVQQSVNDLRKPLITPPSETTLGRTAYEQLQRERQWLPIDHQGEAVLTDNEQEEVRVLTNERAVVNFLTPKMEAIIKESSQRLGLPLVLVNSERHPWVHGAQDFREAEMLKPDQFVAHAACWAKRQNTEIPDNFKSGVLAHWDLRDCLFAVIEWKKSATDGGYKALGQGIRYAECIAHTTTKEEAELVDVVALQSTRLVVADRNGFKLVNCIGGRAVSCRYSGWKEAGSKEALIDFVTGVERPWPRILESVCQSLDIEHISEFLGRGADARAFKVTKGGMDLVVKVSRGERSASLLQLEHKIMTEHRILLQATGSTVCIVEDTGSDFYIPQDRNFAALLIHPSGEPLPMRRKAILSAINGLRSLAKQGIRHGDARHANVIWWKGSQEKALWIDFRQMSIVGSDNQKDSFQSDVMSFVDSFEKMRGRDEDVLRNQAGEYFESPCDQGGTLVESFSTLWS